MMVASSRPGVAWAQKAPMPTASTAQTNVDPRRFYEDAPMANSSLEYQLGASTYKIAAVARNEADGDIRVENGRGQRMAVESLKKKPEKQEFKADRDQIHLYLDTGETRFDVVEIRVFDTVGKRVLTVNDGLTLRAEGNLLKIGRSGSRLPDQLDIWLRVNQYGPDQQPVRMDPQEGSVAAFGDARLKIRTVKEGFVGYTLEPGNPPKINWMDSTASNKDKQCSVAFDRSGSWTRGACQVCAVDKQGGKFFCRRPNWVDFEKQGETLVAGFFVPVNELSHFEWWPYKARNSFYFPGVLLPKVGALKASAAAEASAAIAPPTPRQ